MSFPERPPLGAPAGLGAFLAPGVTSFTDFVTTAAPHLLPGRVPPGLPVGAGAAGAVDIPHGTTIVALTFADGVVIAGDRRATSGNVIAQRDIEKVFVTDSHSAIGIAGTAGFGLQMARLFTVDLEHYEKTEGVSLSFDGKANKLAGMVQQNLGAALQGFVVVPLLVGYDLAAPNGSGGRIVTYDAAGGRYDELLGYHAIGSGSVFAKSALKKRHNPGADMPGAVRAAVEALYDAADDDTATGGPDLTRRIFPVVVSITGPDGAVRRPEDEIESIVRDVVTGRTENPGG
ncbi:proteasome subunit beta [Pseudonocardia sichuanensis]|uniref:Proteasome subunit beta n=1 Tax=Pseudonocardia kunmingensis TaxID=630975 RepID=A0A543D3F8_9PSEU|nr:proteasome subunit beta [Pseudonocardia kunmingensis]TQM03869.1 proteasome beta subunit [Pseudonocardia kunmingensis]